MHESAMYYYVYTVCIYTYIRIYLYTVILCEYTKFAVQKQCSIFFVEQNVEKMLRDRWYYNLHTTLLSTVTYEIVSKIAQRRSLMNKQILTTWMVLILKP